MSTTDNNNNKQGPRGGRGRGRSGRGGRGRGGRSGGRAGRNNSGGDRNNARGRGRTNAGRSRDYDENQGRGSTSTRQTTPSSNTASLPPGNNNNKPLPPLLKNGDKGADAFTVSEATRIGFTKQLMEFRESNDKTSLEFPSTLTNTERKFLHQLASNLGLKSKSTGKGENRKITVTKRNNEQTTAVDNVPRLMIGKTGLQALRKHVKAHPPTHVEELESHETGASLLEALHSVQQGQDDNDDEAQFTAALDQLHLTHQELATPRFKKVRVDLGRRQEFHAQAQEEKRKHAKYAAMMEQRARLPAFAHQDEVVQAIENHRITIISGETGSGKSTQCPQFLLDALPQANIVVTQPRRISAISVAERVAQEQCQNNVGPWIGYQVRLDAALQRETCQLVFVTPGILLRQLQSYPLLEQYTHIIIDEIHERDKYTEFLLAALRDLLPRRPDLRVVFMSATLQLETLLSYWQEQHDGPIAHVQMKGRTYPVQEFYLEHILRMTGYLDHIMGGPVDSAELEAELAALTGGKSLLDLKDSETDAPKAVTTGMNCVLCGKQNFADALALAEHLALCDGVLHEDDEDGPKADLSTKNDDSSSSSDEEEHVKWDGVSTFTVPDKVSDGDENEMLDQYQVMHNDEDVDYNLMVEILRLIVENSEADSAILVFLPGWGEISEFGLLLETTSPFQDSSKYSVLPLHSGIPSQDQRKVLEVPPEGVRKIVLSTNIAETSITIEDVAFVVDTGKAKEKSYDPHLKTSTLQPAWISHASAKQRRGRAGRTKAGVAFHLFSKRRYKSMRPFLESELLRTPLEEMCLLCKKLGLAPGGAEDEDGVPAFLAKAMSPPHPKSITNALELLVDLGAMEPVTNNLTTLGLCLSTISLEPRVAKMVIWSHLLGCSRAAIDMAVAMSYKSPFVMPPPHQRRASDMAKVELSQNSESDQITLMNVLRRRDQFAKGKGGFGGGYFSFCRKNFLSSSTLDMISDLRGTLNRELQHLKFPHSTTMNLYHNRHNNDSALWQAAIAAGLFPNMSCRSAGQTNFTTISSLRQKAKIHISSVNSVKGQPLNSKSQIQEGEIEFVAYGELVRGPQVFTMSQTTHLTSPLPLLLLCGTTLSVFPKNDATSILNLDDMVVFECPTEAASQVVLLRKRLDGSFWKYITNPALGLDNLTAAEKDAVEIVGTVLRSAHKSASK